LTKPRVSLRSTAGTQSIDTAQTPKKATNPPWWGGWRSECIDERVSELRWQSISHTIRDRQLQAANQPQTDCTRKMIEGGCSRRRHTWQADPQILQSMLSWTCATTGPPVHSGHALVAAQ
jgi:hypothetical protein